MWTEEMNGRLNPYIQTHYIQMRFVVYIRNQSAAVENVNHFKLTCKLLKGSEILTLGRNVHMFQSCDLKARL